MASRDLQIDKSQANRLGFAAQTTSTAVEQTSRSVDFAGAALKRQWHKLFAATVISAGFAWILAGALATQKVTARLTLSSASLPATSHHVYTPPNPNIASVLLKSARILQPVAAHYKMPSVPALSRLLTAFPNLTTSSIEVALIQSDANNAMQLLDDIATELVRSIAQDRRSTLTDHADYISGLLTGARSDLTECRRNLAALEESLRLKGVNALQRSAETHDVAAREAELRSSIDECRRTDKRLRSELTMRENEFRAVRRTAFLAVIEARRRQSERLRERLTSSGPATAVSVEIQEQLRTAEQELADIIEDSTEPADEAKRSSDAGAGTARVAPATQDQAARIRIPAETFTTGVKSGDLLSADHSVEQAADELSRWVDRVASIGQETLGGLEMSTLESARMSVNKLSKISDEMRQMQIDSANNQVDLDYFLAKAADLAGEKSQSTQEDVKRSSNELLELKLELEEKERRYSRLSQQLDEINQLKECELTEYVVTSPAAVNPVDDVVSNRRNLFVCSFLGFGLLLTSPIVATELLRLRPSAVTSLSRRWNLPVLGSQACGFTDSPGASGRTEHQDFRLMALRIQQSLCHTDSRVVLFAGLAHGESPLRLIQPLAYCLAQREETVLLIEIPESNGDVGGVHSDSAGQPLIERRAGVSEFLAGKTDDVASLVFPYGGDGFDCLSSGCATVGSEAMASRRLTNLIVQCRAKYTMILLCGPSTLSSTDLQMLAARSDGIVLTVDRKSATSAWTNEVLGDLLELGAPILGLAEHPKSSAGSCRTRIRP